MREGEDEEGGEASLKEFFQDRVIGIIADENSDDRQSDEQNSNNVNDAQTKENLPGELYSRDNGQVDDQQGDGTKNFFNFGFVHKVKMIY
ncbi:MAG: hypothetical protein WCV92_05130 [Candidatus Buchananbacteria bacterium]